LLLRLVHRSLIEQEINLGQISFNKLFVATTNVSA